MTTQTINDREYFTTASLAAAELKRQKMFVTETNSPFNYSDELCTRDAGIRSDAVGSWIEYRKFC